MFGISGGEFLVIIMIALIVFGPGQLPEMARTLGRTLRHLNRMRDDVQRQFRDALHEIEREAEMNEASKPVITTKDNPPPVPEPTGGSETK